MAKKYKLVNIGTGEIESRHRTVNLAREERERKYDTKFKNMKIRLRIEGPGGKLY